MTEYNYQSIMPVKVIYKTEGVTGEENLFKYKNQVTFFEEEKAIFSGKGSIILDFGKEYYGYLRLLICRIVPELASADIQIRLGESVAEVCADIGYKGSYNFHGLKNMNMSVMQFSEIQTGCNGFRFARIDLLSDLTFELINCQLISRTEKINNLGYFECDDQRINEIFNTAKRTIELCQQNGYIWDGIKRDRIVWIGDLHPETLSMLALSGDSERVMRSLDIARNEAKLPFWINSIPAYSMWYILILSEVYFKAGNKDFIIENLDYVNGILNQVDSCIDEDGTIDFKRAAFDEDMGYFLDWATFDTPDAIIGTKSLFVYVLNAAEKMLLDLGEDNSICEKIREKLGGWQEETQKKQIRAFQCFARGCVSKEDADMMVDGGAKGFSTFMSYYILKCMAEGGRNFDALNIVKEYYGSMLDLGATTFFEDFDMDWLKENPLPLTSFEQEGRKHIHADFGKFCYVGLRHSLCHGWSSGVIPYLYEYVAGIKPLEAGYKKVKISPDLCSLKNLKAGICTPYGLLEVVVESKDGKAQIKVNAPKEIEVVY